MLKNGHIYELFSRFRDHGRNTAAIAQKRYSAENHIQIIWSCSTFILTASCIFTCANLVPYSGGWNTGHEFKRIHFT